MLTEWKRGSGEVLYGVLGGELMYKQASKQ
jgi:hypothetical protein